MFGEVAVSDDTKLVCAMRYLAIPGNASSAGISLWYMFWHMWYVARWLDLELGAIFCHLTCQRSLRWQGILDVLLVCFAVAALSTYGCHRRFERSSLDLGLVPGFSDEWFTQLSSSDPS